MEEQNKVDALNAIRNAIFNIRVAVDDADEVAYDLWDKITDGEEKEYPEEFHCNCERLRSYLNTMFDAITSINEELELIEKE